MECRSELGFDQRYRTTEPEFLFRFPCFTPFASDAPAFTALIVMQGGIMVRSLGGAGGGGAFLSRESSEIGIYLGI